MGVVVTALRPVVEDVKRYLESADRVRFAPLPAPLRRAAYLGSFGLVTAAILFLRPLHWESVLGSEVVFEGQAVDRLVWICLFIGLGSAAASFTAGAYGASYQIALPGIVFVVLSGLALLNFSTWPGRSVLSSAASDVPGSVRAAGALIVAGGIAGRLVCLGALILLAASSLRRRPEIGLRLGLLLGGVVAAPALFYLITLTVETPRFPASGDPSSVPALFLRTESIALPMALFVAGSYIIATLAAMQTREAVAAFHNASGHFVAAVSERLIVLRIAAVGASAYWAAYLFELLPEQVGRIDFFDVDQEGVWFASAIMLTVLVGLGRLAARDKHGPSRPALLLLIVVFALQGLLEFSVHIASAAVQTDLDVTGTQPLVFGPTAVSISAVILAVGGALGFLLMRGQRSNAALLLASAAMLAPGLILRIEPSMPIPTPIHLAVLVSVAAAVGVLLFPDRLTSAMRRWVSAALAAIIILLAVAPAIAGVVDGRLFGIGIVAAYTYRFLVRGADLNDRAEVDPGIVPRAVGGSAAVAVTGWAVVAFTERFSAGGEAAAFWTGYGSSALASIAVPMVVVFAAQRARQAKG